MENPEPSGSADEVQPSNTYRLLVEYDGTAFSGWQAQPRQRTIQAEIERALSVALRQPVSVVGSGRTDAGVHARGQVAHFRTLQVLEAERIRGSLNGLLPRAIRIISLAPAPSDFHARYGAVKRRYHYYLATVPIAIGRHARAEMKGLLDFEQMNRAASSLVGRHDFSTFCRTSSETINRVCTVFESQWIAEERNGHWHYRIVADRFLHGMVRAVAGTMIEVGRGRRLADDIERLLSLRDRRAAGPAAPPRGLVLEEVLYGDENGGGSRS